MSVRSSEILRTLDSPPQGLLVITSTSLGQYAVEDENLGHGVFAHFVLEALSGKVDSTRDGLLTWRELFDYSARQTRDCVARTHLTAQRPRISRAEELSLEDFVLASLNSQPVGRTAGKKTERTSKEDLLRELSASKEQMHRDSSENDHIDPRRAESMRRIGGAIQRFCQDHAQRVPSRFATDESGKPTLSWRVHLLPYLGETELYKRFHLLEPWDSPHNRTLISEAPDVYRVSEHESQVPGNDWLTPFLAFNHDDAGLGLPVGNGWYAGHNIRDTLDGTTNTLAVVEVADSQAVIWTQPSDLAYVPGQNINPARRSGSLGLYLDGTVRLLPESIPPADLEAMVTRSGSENNRNAVASLKVITKGTDRQ